MPGCLRSVMFDRNHKEIPYLHVANAMQNMGLTMGYFKEWAKENC